MKLSNFKSMHPGPQLLMAAVAVVFACVAVSSAKQKQHQRESATQRIRCCNVVARSVPPEHAHIKNGFGLDPTFFWGSKIFGHYATTKQNLPQTSMKCLWKIFDPKRTRKISIPEAFKTHGWVFHSTLMGHSGLRWWVRRSQNSESSLNQCQVIPNDTYKQNISLSLHCSTYRC